MRRRLLGLDELPAGELRRVEVDGDALVLARTPDGAVHALRDRCAHEGARISRGRLLRAIAAEDVDRSRVTDDYVIRCPWHGYEFDVTSGACLGDPRRARVRTYPVIVDDDAIWLER